ncbi:MAG: Free methionine-(R)-sulfoxide reductase, contains GAF domain [Candidatus Saccharicenans subterraneus]|uniref:Free methionine-(R)-sulfoxide reductase, contains GAF domain n=1 Tax=Candidatus Saccharicenans subterraneus TaxID=2508984 RepID=A0A3E2BMG9_9BACT|nr:MAG: Free methionine-(R)-sulfoxide reductase, contains GAF domain [Candidatus Saccharicenans subterraneum]
MYERIFEQLKDMFQKSDDPIARMVTVSALLYHKIDYYFWCGFYLLKEGELIVGPYQGPLACLKLAHNKGVCWAGVREKKPIIVPDVHRFPDHIACDERSQSEIVVPVFTPDGRVCGVIDVDSDRLASFDETDARYLEEIAAMIFRK